MVERGIDIDHVKQAVRNPDFTEPKENGRMLARKKIDEKRTIEVIYFKQRFRDNHDPVIVTAYYLS